MSGQNRNDMQCHVKEGGGEAGKTALHRERWVELSEGQRVQHQSLENGTCLVHYMGCRVSV